VETAISLSDRRQSGDVPCTHPKAKSSALFPPPMGPRFLKLLVGFSLCASRAINLRSFLTLLGGRGSWRDQLWCSDERGLRLNFDVAERTASPTSAPMLRTEKPLRNYPPGSAWVKASEAPLSRARNTVKSENPACGTAIQISALLVTISDVRYGNDCFRKRQCSRRERELFPNFRNGECPLRRGDSWTESDAEATVRLWLPRADLVKKFFSTVDP